LSEMLEPSHLRAWSGLGFSVSKRHGDFAALQSVNLEMSQIFHAGVLPGVWLPDRGFTIHAFEHEMKSQPSVVHVASHFYFDPAHPIGSFLLTGDGAHFTMRDLSNCNNLFRGVDLLTLSA